MKRTKEGFLVLEAMTGLIVAVIGVSTLFLCLGKTKEIVNKQELRIDYYLAAEMLINSSDDKVLIHDHKYSLINHCGTSVELYDETSKKSIKL